MLIKESM